MNVLFVCTLNKARSVAAERLYRRCPGMQVRSAGTSERAAHQITEDDLVWADRVVVFEAEQGRWIRATFAGSGLQCRVVTVPRLDDDDLARAAAEFPKLAVPLGNGRLRDLLRNPYALDRAIGIDWLDGSPLPQCEREFRERFWRDVVRNGDPMGDMPRKRDACFLEVARRRAEALTPYADCAGLDRDALRSLRSSSLVVADDDDHYATAHDVLEDWAILRWIESINKTCEGSVRDLSAGLGESPAVRRAFRKWAAELVATDPVAADRLFRAAAAGEGNSDRFNDDCLVALLQSDAAPAFLAAHVDLLAADGNKLLIKAIHLLRVACYATPDGESTGDGSRVPTGAAWASVLSTVKELLPSFTSGDRELLLGLIEDWAGGITAEDPYPAGSPDAAAIAMWALSDIDGWVPREMTGRALRVLCKIPKANADGFAAMLTGAGDDHAREHTDDLRKIVLEGVEGVYAARDLPEAVCAATADYLLDTRTGRDEGYHFAADFGVEASFGIHRGRQHAYFPPSAFRGPLLFLLRHHHRHGIKLVQTVFNHCGDRYSRQDGVRRKLEQPKVVTIAFSNGSTREQWYNGRLWGLYRGLSVSPYCLQSMLMALERWLREVAESGTRPLDQFLLALLMGANNAAVTAVVASIAVAYPRRCEETLLTLLGVRAYVQIDLSRSAAERGADINGMGLATDPFGEFYAKERREANAWPHRRGHIETAIWEMQSGPLAERIHAVIDRHRSALPPVGKRDEDDLIWSIAIDRMDRRQLAMSEPRREIVAADGTQYIQVETRLSDPDAKAMADETAARHANLNERLSLLVWATRSFRREPVEGSAETWRDRLAAVRALPSPDDPNDLAAGAPAFVAAVCVRDHWEHMGTEDREWCIRVVRAAVSDTANTWDPIERMQRHSFSADRACATVLPQLLGQCGVGEALAQVRDAVFVAATHPVDEVRASAFHGIAEAGLWETDRPTAKACLNAAAAEAIETARARDAERRKPYDQQRQSGAVPAEVAASVLARLRSGHPDFAGDAFLRMDSELWVSDDAAMHMLTVLGSAPGDAAAAQAYAAASGALSAKWASGRDTRSHFQVECAVADQIADFVVRAPEHAAGAILRPIVGLVGRCSEETGRFVQSLIRAEDRHRQGAKFWHAWEAFADAAVAAHWVLTLDWEHPTGRYLLAALFLTETHWNDGVRHWRCLEGFSDRVDSLYDRLPAVPLASELYVLFLFHVGERSLPDGFVRLAARLRAGNPAAALANYNARYHLEMILRRFVYGKPLEIKSRTAVRDSVRYLLDRLVEAGSSAAYPSDPHPRTTY